MKPFDLAIRANELSGWENYHYLDTLAAAYAAAGQFNKAIDYQNEAIFSYRKKWTDEESALLKRLNMYGSRQALVE